MDTGLDALKTQLQCPHLQRIDCIDISHMGGKFTYGAVTVWEARGLNKRNYRTYKITQADASDDYAALYEVVSRRYTKEPLPDVLLLDGGQEHVRYVLAQIAQHHPELHQRLQNCKLAGLAKGANRAPTKDRLWVEQQSCYLDFKSHPALFAILQKLRDEAHRRAGMAMRRAKQTQQS